MATTNSVFTFAAVAYNEVLLNSKRVASYVLMIICSGTALLGWVRGPAIGLGWATNSDFYIARTLKAFSFLLGPPLFSAVIMGDAIIRDFRWRIDPLIFSKPLSRAQYFLGKFVGNFFVLICCMSAFPLTLMLLQAFHPSRMVVQQAKVTPYFKHFFFFVVITHLTLAAVYFAVGTLTRNSKIVYGLAVSFYPIYVSLMLFLVSPLTIRWKIFFDAFLLSSGPSNNGFGNSAEFLNSYVVTYTPEMIGNRILLIFGAVLLLMIAYLRFTRDEAAVSTKHFLISRLRGRLNLKRVRVFAAVFSNEVRLNSKRIAPYFMVGLCSGMGVLWWGWGPAIGRGVAINSDFFIAGVMPPYSFLFLPLFTAVFMGDPVNRDFRHGVDPLLFSKPIGRAEYLLGKFFGNFFVLACCQAAMPLTWFLLQPVPKQGLVTLPGITVIPYIKHFLVLLVISHLGLAAFYFAVGVLTRSPKIVYGIGVAFYPVYMTYLSVVQATLGRYWKLALDPLVLNRGDVHVSRSQAEYFNQLVVTYDTDLIINRIVMILLAAICLTIVYKFFTTTERSTDKENLSLLNLSTASEGVYYPDPATGLGEFERAEQRATLSIHVAIPDVGKVNNGIGSNVNKLIGALGVEFRLLVAERSLVVVMPLAILLSIFEVAFYNIPPDISHSVAYATNTAKLLLLFLIGISVFYTGEAIHRDRELKIEGVIWSTPVKNNVLLFSKWLATILLTIFLVAVVGLTAMLIQLMKGHRPVGPSAYLMVYGVVLIPGIIFIASFVVALNVLLRNKYAAYVMAIGTGVVLFYLYSVGHNHWLFNPFLYQLWKYQDLTSGKTIACRLYWVAGAMFCLALAHVAFERKSKNQWRKSR